MKMLRPLTITDALLTSSSVAEADFAVWSAATTYAVGDKVIKAHRIWQSVVASNLNHAPDTSGVSYWVDVGPTNRWAMFDTTVGTKTTATDSLSVTLTPGRIDSIAVLTATCAEVEIAVQVGSETVYSRTESMIDSGVIIDWFGYFFDEPVPRSDLVLTDLPVYGEGVLTVTLSGSGAIACGALIVGRQAEIGNVLQSPTVGIIDFSSITRDDFGNPTLVKRSFSKRCDVKLALTRAQVDYVYALLADYRATPMVWIGGENAYQSLIVFGYYKDFEIDIAFPTLSYCTLSIEGMN